jgi:hypothetical protein
MVTTISDPYNIGDYGGALSAGAGGTIANSDPYNIGIPSSVLSAGATAPNIFQQPSALGQIFGGLMGAGQSILSSPDALMGLGGGLLTKEAYDRLSDIGEQAKREAMGLAERGQMESQFKPFTVTTPTGAMFTARMGGQPRMPSGFGQPMPRETFGYGTGPDLQPLGQPSMMLPPRMGELDRQDEELRRQLMSLPRSIRGGTNEFGQEPTIGLGNMVDFNNLPTRLNETERENLLKYQNIKNRMDEVAAERRRLSPPQGGLLEGPLTNFAEVPVGQLAGQLGIAQPQPTADGLQIGMELSPEERALQQQLIGGAGTFFGQAAQPTVDREQAIFERMRAAQRPEEERQRLALEQRLAAQGRLGASSAAYGGATPELLALSAAEREARDRSMLTAMQQAQAEQAQQAALGGQFLGAGYLPQQQLVAALQPGLIQQELAQQAQQFGTGLFGETALSGIEAQLLQEQARANLLGGIGSNLITGLMNQQRAAAAQPSGGGSSGLGGLFGDIVDDLGTVGSGIRRLFNF